MWISSGGIIVGVGGVGGRRIATGVAVVSGLDAIRSFCDVVT